MIETLVGIYNKRGGVIKTLIFCPIAVTKGWKKEFSKYSDIPESKVILLTGSGEKRRDQLCEAAILHQPDGFIAITNYESLNMDSLYEDLMRVFFGNLIIFDESQKIKSLQAKRTKQAVKLAKNNTGFLLSGTPVLASPMDLFSQFLAMDKGKSFGVNFYGFRARYFFDANQYMPSHVKFPNWQVRPGALEEINRIVSENSKRVKKADCLDLPPLIRQINEVDMGPEQSRMYRSMERDFIAYLNDKACVAQLALTKAIRLQQIVSGFCMMEDGSLIRFEDNPRLKALEELLIDLSPHHKILVWATFRENYAAIRQLCEKNKINYVECHGETPQKEKLTVEDRFNQDDSIRVFIGHPISGGVGLNLTTSNISIYYSRDFSLEADLQSEARNYRGGSEVHSKVTRIDLVASKTIDEIVLEKLANKEQMGEHLLSNLKHYLLQK